MATANELLNSMMNSEVDRTLVIDNDLRTITIPSVIKALGVQYDDDVHRLKFAMPRMYGDTDLSTFNIRINYLNAANKGDIYVVTDKVVKSATIEFSWLVGPNALSYKGSVKFIVCLKESDSEGTILREFNTTIATLPVLEGLEVNASSLSTNLADVLEQLQSLTVAKVAEVEEEGSAQIAKVQEESTKQQGNIVEKGAEVLATIPEDYQTTTELANEGVRTKADAIVETAEGSAIAVHDSSDDHIRNLKIFGRTTQISTTGKNLFNISQIATSSQLTIDNGVITITTPSSSSAVTSGKKLSELAPNLEVGIDYILTFNTTGSDKFVYLDGAGFSWSPGATRTMTQEMLDSTVLFYASGVSTSAKITNVMIRLATIEDTTYEPYTGGVASPSENWPQELVSIENLNTNIHGKNLIPYPYLNTSTVSNGITFTANDDGTVTANGTATGTAYFTLQNTTSYDSAIPISRGTYVLSGAPIEYCRVAIALWKNKARSEVHSSIEVQPYILTVNDDETRFDIVCTVDTGAVLNNVVFKPQLEVGSIPSDYEPYKPVQSISISNAIAGLLVTSNGNYTDENGQQWICDEIDFDRGVYVQRIIKLVLDGSESWLLPSNSMYALKLGSYGDVITGAQLCTHFTGAVITTSTTDSGVFVNNSSANKMSRVCIRPKSGVTSVSDFTDWLSENPVTLYYALTTPIETPLTEDEIAAFEALRTNYPNTTILNDAGAWMSVDYNADTKTYIENPKILKLVDSSTGVVYELKIVDGVLTVVQV